MLFKINNASRRPVYLQLIDQIKQKIAVQQLKAGDKLPTVRELAITLVVNPNTVQKVYTELANEGLIHSRKGRGVFVSETSSNLSEEERLRRVEEALDLFLTEALLLEFKKNDIQKLVKDRLHSLKAKEGRDD